MKSIILFVLLILCLIKRDIVISSSVASLTLWCEAIFPTMFTLFVLIDLLENTFLPKTIANMVYPLLHFIFGIRYKYSSYIIIMSLLTGNPASAKMISNALGSHKIDYKEANHLIRFLSFMNPLFLFTLGQTLFNSTFYFYRFILASYLGNLIFGIVSGQFYKNKKADEQKNYTKEEGLSLFESINKNMSIIINILGVICLFNTLTNVVMSCFNINAYFKSGIKLLLEILSGSGFLASANLNRSISIVFISFAVGFNGFSIHLQIRSVFKEINYGLFILSKIIISIISSFICLIPIQKIINTKIGYSYQTMTILIFLSGIIYLLAHYHYKNKKTT